MPQGPIKPPKSRQGNKQGKSETSSQEYTDIAPNKQKISNKNIQEYQTHDRYKKRNKKVRRSPLTPNSGTLLPAIRTKDISWEKLPTTKEGGVGGNPTDSTAWVEPATTGERGG